jgi:hypothetical protein
MPIVSLDGRIIFNRVTRQTFSRFTLPVSSQFNSLINCFVTELSSKRHDPTYEKDWQSEQYFKGQEIGMHSSQFNNHWLVLGFAV